MTNCWVFAVGKKVVGVYAETYLKATDKLLKEYGHVEFKFVSIKAAYNGTITDYIY